MGNVRPNSIAALDLAYHLHPTTDIKALHETGPLVLKSAEGVFVVDEDGKTYLDAMAGLWSASLGFQQSRVAEVVHRQMQEMGFYHTFAGKTHPAVAELAERLIRLAPPGLAKVLFQNSGSEANDAAIKIIWYYNNALERTEKKKIIGRHRGYHGITVATGSVTGLPNFHKAFDLPIGRFLHTECPYFYREALPGETEEDFSRRLASSLEELIEREGAQTIAAFFAEPVMAAGGVLPPPAGYFRRVQEILKKNDILFVADEVVCGFGRTGSMWGSETYQLRPDMISCAKALSGSFLPISALMISSEIYDVLAAQSQKIGVFAHGSTYSGHPACAVAAIETLKIYDELGIVDRVRRAAVPFQAALAAFRDHPLVGDVRGVGLLGAIEMVGNKETKEGFGSFDAGRHFVSHAMQNGMITRASGDIVLFSPPLVISPAEIELLQRKIGESLDATHEFVRSWTAPAS